MDDQPCIALQARRRAVRGCIAEPAFGYILETFRFGWRRFPEALTRYIRDWNPYTSLHATPLAVCPADPWPEGILDDIHRKHSVITLDAAWVEHIQRRAEEILETRLPNARPHLMAFLAQHDDLRCAGLTEEVATAWALQFARDQLLKAELSRQHLLGEPEFHEQLLLPSGTTVRFIP